MRMPIATVSLSLALLAALSTVATAADAITGYISDAKCATSGSKAKTAAEWIKPAAFEACVKKCVKEGSDAVFVTEDNKILKFDTASLPRVTRYLGRKVSVTGNVKDGTIKIASIAPLKME
jgi:hypothetical protein